MRQNTRNRWPLIGILSSTVVAIGAFIFLLRPAQQLSEQPDGANLTDATGRVPGRLEQLDAAQRWSGSLDPKTRLENNLRAATSRLSDVTHVPSNVAGEAPEEEGETIEVPNQPQAAQAGIVAGHGPGAEETRQTAGESRAATNGTEAAVDTNGEKKESAHQAADGGSQKTEGTQQGTAKTDSTTPTDSTRIKANTMDWNPDTAYKGEDGNVHASSGSTLRSEVNLNSPAGSVSIWARADQAADGTWPKMRVSVDGTPMGEVTINSTDEQKYHVPIYADPGYAVVELTPITQGTDPNSAQNPNVHVHKITVWPQGH